MSVERVALPEFHSRCMAQGVTAREHIAMVCPVCGTVQSIASLLRAGAKPDDVESLLGWSCEGRLTNAGPWPNKLTKQRRAVRGCDWTLGGLFRIHALEVVTEDGEAHPRFALATAKQAQELERSASAGVRP